MKKKIDLLVGDDFFLIKRKIQKIIQKLAIDKDQVETKYWDLSDKENIQEILNAIGSQNFFKITKIVVKVNDFKKLTKKLKSEFIAQFELTKNLIFLWFDSSNSKKIDIQELGPIVSLVVVKKINKKKLVEDFLTENNIYLKEETKLFLINELPNKNEWINNELDKVLFFYKNNSTITIKQLKNIITNYEEDLVFPLIEAILMGDKQKIINKYLKISTSQKDAFYIVSVLETYLFNLTKIFILKEKGYSTAQISQTLNKKYYFISKLEIIYQQVSKKYIKLLLEKIIKLKYLTRRIKLEDQIILENFLFTLK